MLKNEIIDIEQEITEYLDGKKLRLVNPDREFYMRMPQFKRDAEF